MCAMTGPSDNLHVVVGAGPIGTGVAALLLDKGQRVVVDPSRHASRPRSSSDTFQR